MEALPIIAKSSCETVPPGGTDSNQVWRQITPKPIPTGLLIAVMADLLGGPKPQTAA